MRVLAPCFRASILVALSLSAALAAQSGTPALPPSPQNLSFQDGEIGKFPKSWGGSRTNGYTTEIRHDGCKNGGNCAVVIGSTQSDGFGTVTQGIDATPYRGKIIRLRAWLKAEPSGSSDRTQMWLRVDRGTSGIGLFDNMDNRPVTTPQWVQAEIGGAVNKDATAIYFGVMSLGHGKAWVDGMTFDVVRDATEAELAKVAVQSSGRPMPTLGKWDLFIPAVIVLVFAFLMWLPATRPHLANALLPQLGPEAPRWNPATRLLFMLFFCNLLLRALPDAMWNNLNVWSAVHVFHLSGDAIVPKITGSGDKALNWMEAFNMLAISAAVTLVWAILDRWRANYAALNTWMRLLVRYSLAGTLFGYGFAKVFPLQMPAPSFRRLMEPWGDFSPMGIAWTFIGTSVAYEAFCGACEVLCGILLLFRRTALAGALMSVMVMTHVLVLNMCFDIPVKLYSFSLILAAAYIVAPDAGRLFSFLFLNRTTPPSTAHPPVPENRWVRWTSLVLKAGAICWLLSQTLTGSYQSYRQRVASVVRPPLYGLYEVERFVRDGQIVTLQTDPARWKKFMWEKEKIVDVIAANDARSSYPATADTARRTITLSQPGGAADVLTYAETPDGLLRLQGTLAGKNVEIWLRNSRLLSTGFHWIAEMPVNR